MKTRTLKQISLALMTAGLTAAALAQQSTYPTTPSRQIPGRPTAPPNAAAQPNSMPEPNATASEPSTTERLTSRLTSQQFVTDASVGNIEEVQLGKLALEKTQNAAVRGFASRMVQDHSACNVKLEAIARAKGLSLPATNLFAADDPNWSNPMLTGSQPTKDAYLLTTNMPLAQYQTIKHLNSLTGRSFDEAYAKDMVSDHSADIHEFELAQRDLSDPELRQFATETLPTLRIHLQMAQKMESQVNNSPTALNQPAHENNRTTASIGGGM